MAIAQFLIVRFRPLSTGAVAAVAILAACGTREHTVPAPSPERDSLAATIAACQQAWRDIPAPGTGDVSLGVRRILTACAELHRARPCQDAWRSAADAPPESRMVLMASGCRQAYCGSLSEPSPLLCDREVSSLPPSELGPAFGELERRILIHDLGPRGEELADAMARAVAGVQVQPSPPARPEVARARTSSIRLLLRRNHGSGAPGPHPGDAFEIVREGNPDGNLPQAQVLLEATDAAQDSERLRRLLSGTPSLILVPDPDVPYSTTIRVMDAARSLGITEFSIESRP